MKKRGSHVGMMLSFAIFIVFIIFLYSIMEPALKTEKDKQALLDFLKREIVKNATYDMTTSKVTILLSPTTNNCVNLLGIYSEIGIDDLELMRSVIVTNDLDELRSAYVLNPDLKVNRNNLVENNLKIYNSEAFDEFTSSDINPCDNLNYETNYEFDSVTTKQYVFEEKFRDLRDMYNSDYEDVRENLNVPIGSGFGFTFTRSDETVIETDFVDVSKSVYVDEFPIQYIDSEANVLPGFLSIRVW